MNDAKTQSPLIFLIAGEHSGDQLGKSLMRGLKELDPHVRFTGVGGPAMQEEGLTSIFPMEDLSVMGLSEVLPRLPLLLRRIRQTITEVRTCRPDCVVTIDSPDFCFRVAKKLKGDDIPLVHYVAPSVWAWRPGRAKKIAGFLDHLLALLPFEPPYFEREGLKCSFIGHPILESGLDQGDGVAFRKQYDIQSEKRLLCMLPGSRRGEIERLLPVFCDTVSLLKHKIPELHVIIPTLSTTHELVKSIISKRDFNATIVNSAYEKEKADIFASCQAALAASGTVALELAVAKVPTVIAYKVSPLTAFIARRVLKNRFYSLINLTLDRLATPENMQENCTAEILAMDVEKLFNDPSTSEQQRQSYEEALIKLGKGTVNPGKMAAQCILDTISHKQN